MIHQIAEFLSQPLMMDAAYVSRLSSIKSAKDLVKHETPSVLMAAKEQAASASKSSGKIVAVLPVYGMIDARDSWMLEFIGGTSLESLKDAVDLCLNEPRIGGIVFDFDTGGGSAYGVKVMADYLYECRSMKPMVSCVRYVMASAGYYLGSATSRIIAEPTSQTGSIGVIMDHYDESRYLENLGITPTIFRVPDFKAEGHPAEALTDAAKTHIQQRIESLYNDFTSDVARYRGVDQKTVIDTYGQGRCLSAKDALKCGMIDRIGTFDEVCDQMASGTMQRSLAQSGRMEGHVDAAVLKNRMDFMRHQFRI